MLTKTVFSLFVLLIIPITASALEAEPSSIDLTKTNPAELVISGEIDEYLGTKRLVLTILAPDNSQTEYDVRVVEKGPFSKSITVTEDWVYGNYIIYAKYGDEGMGTTNFIIEEPYDPRKDTKMENSDEVEKVDEKPIPAPFVDPELDPQYYVDRYFNEPKYKEWFDENYSQYNSIYEAVGLEEASTRNQNPPRFSDDVLNELDRKAQSCTTYECQQSLMYSQMKYAQEHGLPLTEPKNRGVDVCDDVSSYCMEKWGFSNSDAYNQCVSSNIENCERKKILAEANERNLTIKKVPYNSYINDVIGFSFIPPNGWDIVDDKEKIENWELLELISTNYSSEYPPLISISYENRGISFGTNMAKMTDNLFLQETARQLQEENFFDGEVLESTVKSTKDKKIGSVLLRQELPTKDGKILSIYHLMTTMFYYSGDLFEFHLYSDPSDYERSSLEFNKIIDTFYFGQVQRADPPEIICGKGTIEKNGQCVLDPNHKAVQSESRGGCLIATATYGSELSPQVQQLREIRDSKLLKTESGTNFMNAFNDFYYSFSPFIADYERENPIFKEAVKLGITPMIATLSLMDYAETEYDVLWIGISLIMLNIGMYVGIPAFAIISMWKRF